MFLISYKGVLLLDVLKFSVQSSASQGWNLILSPPPPLFDSKRERRYAALNPANFFDLQVHLYTHEHNWRAKLALTWRLDGEFVLPRMAACGVYIYMLYAHNPASAWKILRTRLMKQIVVMEKPP